MDRSLSLSLSLSLALSCARTRALALALSGAANLGGGEGLRRAPAVGLLVLLPDRSKLLRVRLAARRQVSGIETLKTSVRNAQDECQDARQSAC
jgi:hypothetical protein